MNRLGLAARLLVLGFAGTAFAAPFQNGSFEPAVAACGANQNLPSASGAIPGWTVSAGNIDWISSCAGGGWAASDGSYSLDLIGGGDSGGIRQTFDTVPGQTYEVIFDLAGNPQTGFPPAVKSLTVTVNGTPRSYTFNTTDHALSSIGWTPHSLTFVASGGSTIIDFFSTGSAVAGAAIDNVRVLAIPAGAWTGSGGSVLSGNASPYSLPMICSGTGAHWSQSGGGPFTYPPFFTGFGVQGPVVASYAVSFGNTAQGICGTWTATTTATSTSTVAVAWQYTGDHASNQTTVDLLAFVSRGGSVVQSNYVVSSVLAQNFHYFGQYSFNVQPGDIYGFTMTGSNYDYIDGMRGTLSVTGTGASSLGVQSSANPAPVGSLVTFTAAVTGNNPRGTVEFTDGGNVIAGCAAVPLVPIDAVSSSAACNTSSLSPGNHGIGVLYGGDMTNLRAANMLGQTITAGSTATTTTLASSLNPSTAGSTVTFTASVTGNAPTGNVQFTDGGSTISSCSAAVPLAGSGNTRTAQCTTSLPAGAHSIIAYYGGDASNFSSQSEALAQVVDAVPTTTSLVSSANPSSFGSPVTFTVQVLGTVNSPTGTVAFTDGGFPIAGCTAVVLIATGSPLIATADCITSSLSAGSHVIGATYSGDVLNAGSGNTLAQDVNPPVVLPTAWTGSAGSVTNAGVPVPPGTPPPYPGTPIGSLPSVVSDGTAVGSNAVFTYATINDYCCHTGDWTFETIANTSGAIRRNWSYTGYHGTCQAQASLTAFIRRGGVIVYSQPVYSASDSSCNGALPSGGFGEYGEVIFPGVVNGDTYGFTMHASNYDSNGGVLGRLTVTIGTSPTTTTAGASATPGLYGVSSRLTATVTGSAPTGTVTFTQQGRIIFGCDAVPLIAGAAACWTVLPPGSLNVVALYTGDTANAGSVSTALIESVNAGPPPASFVVNSTADAADAVPNGICADSFGSCTLRAAVMEASAVIGAATITVPAGTFLLGIGTIDISGNVTVSGAGAANTIVDGAGLHRVFNVSSGVVTISGLTVRNGHTNAPGAGAGIENSASLTLNEVVVSGNTSGADGGGIYNHGTLLALNGSTVSDNVGGGGAGIYSFNSILTLTNSTISSNDSIGVGQCGFGGGGMLIYGGSATIINSTLFANFAQCVAGAGGRGHALASPGGATVTIRNSILSSPTLGGQVCYGPVTSLGHSLVGDGTCGLGATDLVVSDPLLTPLSNFGGPTRTHELAIGSPARDAVPSANCATALDQRGVNRPAGLGCDIGSVESTPLQVPTTTTLEGDPSPALVDAIVTFTATVGGSNPTGTVDFIDGVTPLCSDVSLTGGIGDTRTATCATSSLPEGSWLITALYSGDSNNQSSSGQWTQDIEPPPAPALAAPTLVRVIEDAGGNSAIVIAHVDNAVPLATTYVQAYAATSCVGGVPAGVGSVGLLPSAAQLTIPGGQLTTDGYFAATVPSVSSGQFLVIRLTNAAGAPISDASACLPSLAGNDFWTTALLVGGEGTLPGSSGAGDYIDTPGKTRWFKFKVAPGQRITVTLSGLPADYDLAVFKDIGAAYAAQIAPPDSAALTKLSAEFAPSAFSPSAFSPSAFSPSAFSPSAFSPSAFSPSAFSPSAFSPSAFSPSAFSPSAFSPSAFSPSAFSPSAFSPSAFSPSAFSPSAFSPSAFSADVIATAFSSAQTRSIIAVSATPGAGNETAVVDSWNNSGYFYARVTGRGAAFSSAGQFNVGITKGTTSCAGITLLPHASRPAQGGAYTTVILTDSSVLTDGALATKLATFAARSEIGGVVVDVAGDTFVQALKDQADDNSSCPYAVNLVAEEIKTIVDSYRNSNLKYVVIAGGDDSIPFFRYPDESLLGQESGYVPPVTGVSDASLRGDYVLSQDAYGAKTRISLRTSDFPVPGLAVGRLVKTPAEIAGMIDAYTAATVNGTTVQPGSSLVTGYDFLADAADAVKAELQSGIGAAPDQLIAAKTLAPQDSWTADQLGAALFSRRHDVVFLAGHFSANSALAADFQTNLITSDIVNSTTDFKNSIVFSAGCHSGYGIVDRDAIAGATFTLDWAQAFARKQATLIAGTGYQYGDTDFIGYSERLYLNFAKELRAGTGPVAVGEALVKAKIAYLAATPDIRGIHTKALLEATLYGLPMLGVNMPQGRGGAGSGSGFGPVIGTVAATGPAATLGLRTKDLNLNPSDLATMPRTQQLTGATTQIAGPLASWLEGTDGVVSNPAEPALPLKVVNVTPTDGTIVLRGVGFRGGTFGDSTVVPLTGAPATEIRGVHTSFASPYFFPMRPWTVNYFGALAGNGATSLLVTPAQHRTADLDPAGTGALRSTLRSFTDLDLRLYYSGNYGNANQQVSLSDAPSIVSVGAQPATAGNATFTAQVTGDPAAAIHEVWVIYANGGTWVPVDLKQCIATLQTPLPVECGTITDSQIWKRTASVPGGDLQYVVQAANGLGLVAFDDNRGAYYTFTGTGAPPEPAQTALSFVSAPSTASYGDAVSVTAQLTSNGSPVGGGIVTVNIAGMGNAGTTSPSGNVTFHAVVANAPGTYEIEAAYLGNETLKATSVKRSFAVSAAPTTMSPLSSPAIGVNLKAPVVNGNATTQEPLAGQSVSFLLTTTGGSQTVVVNTDTEGNATLPIAGLAAGTYTIAASFLPASVAGSVTNYAGATLTLPNPVVKSSQSIALTAPATMTDAAPGTFPVSAAVSPNPNSGQPIKITSTTPTVCTVAGTPAANQASYTATIVTAGPALCALVAEVVGNNAFAPANTAATVSITKAPAVSTTSLSVSPLSSVLGQPVVLTATVTTALGGGIPAGTTVTFAEGETPLAAPVPVVVATGKALLTTSTLALGSHVLTATYNGNANVAASTGTANVTVGQFPTTTALTADKVSPVPFGTTINLKATVTPGAATGAVTFIDSATTLGSKPLVSGGTATLPTSALAVGTHSLTATYGGATNYAPSSTTLPLTLIIKEAFTAANAMLQARVSHTATLLNDGRVLVAGGSGAGDDDTRASRTAEIYCPDPYTPPATPVRTLAQWCPNGLGKFSAAGRGNTAQVGVGNLVQARTYHTATLLPNGTVLLAGGYDGSGARTATAEVYDPTDPIADKFTAVASLPANAAAGHSATLITKSGKAYVLIVGGNSANAQLYDTTTKTWTRSGSMTVVRSNHTATVVGAKVFVAGGTDSNGRSLQSTTLYDIAAGTFANGPTMLSSREFHTASAIAGGKILLAGGRASTGLVTNTVALTPLAEIYDPGNATTPFVAKPFVPATGRFGHSASALLGTNGLADGRIFVTGGATTIACGQQLATSQYFAANAFAASTTMAAARVRHTATVLKDGRVLIAGGRGSTGSNCGPLKTAEIWNGPSP